MINNKYIEEEIWKLKNKDKPEVKDNGIPPNLIDGPIGQRNLKDEKVIQLAKNNLELDLLANIREGYKDWLKAGNEGSQKDYLDTLSMDDLKRLSLREGGSVGTSNKPKEPVAVKDIDLTQELLKTADYLSKLSESERATIDWILKRMGTE
tara:strand:- start:98 stop:550 length:453 start_codon:yes stop_codon:yes gene_type:complete